MSYWVYVHTCPNGKRYVGCTTQAKPERRWGKRGEGYKDQLFGKAVRKYGWSSITHEVFEVDSAEEMYRKEVELISFYHSNDPRYGYNNSVGGEKSSLGCRYSSEHRKHLAEAVKKAHLSPEYRRKQSEAMKKAQSDPEYRRKKSELQKKKWSDPEYRKRLSEAHKGKSQPRISIKLSDGTTVEVAKNILARDYVNKGKKFEYVD